MCKFPLSRYAVTVGAALLSTVACAGPNRTVTYNGKVISSDVRVIDGKAFIPLSDAAHALGGSAVPTGSGFSIKSVSGGAPSGGANQINGLTGKVGQMLFTGKWRFEVLSFTTTQEYHSQFAASPNTDDPKGGSDELVVVNCLVKNAQTETSQLFLRTANPMDSTVTDADGASYGSPIDFDFPGGSGYGPTLAPGAAVKFAVVFDVPSTIKLGDLIFSIATLEDRDHPADARISLAR